MQDIQEIFNLLQKGRKEQKEIRSMYKSSLSNSAQYKEIIEQLKVLKEKKKEIENIIKAEFSREFSQLDNLKTEAEGNKIMLSDIALNKLIKGEHVEVIDEHNTRYEPIFNVAFKRI